MEKLGTRLANPVRAATAASGLKYVLVMPDFLSCGLWDARGKHLTPESVPLSPALRRRLKAWCAQYDRHNWERPRSDQQAEAAVVAISHEGREIAKALKAEQPDWTVDYFDEFKFFRGETEPVCPM